MNIERLANREDEGFTLIELMVVVLIIAILLAIAIPTFLGARGQANSRAAQSSLRNALTAEQTFYTNNQAFNDTTGSPNIASIEPNLTWDPSGTFAASSPNTITVTTGGVSVANDSVLLETSGKDGNCYLAFQTNAASGGAATGYAIVNGACASGSTTGLVTMAASGMTAPSVHSGSASGNLSTAGSDGFFYTAW